MLSRLNRTLALRLRTKPLSMRNAEAVVSISFDDFPESAWTVGGALLEKAGVQATYFTSSGLLSSSENGLRVASAAEVAQAHGAGHEIGCHTYDHVDCRGLRASELNEQLSLNSESLRGITGDIPVTFAYPRGSFGVSTKRTVIARYACARTSYRGLNAGTIDLAAVRAIPLYSRAFDRRSIERLLDDAMEKAAWVNFYTHDIDDAPSGFGSTPAHLAETLDLIRDRQIRVLPVRDALAFVGLGNQQDGGA